jgi:hypothetical protein
MEQDFLAYLVSRGHLPEQRSLAIRQTVRIAREPIGAIAFAHGLLTGEDIDLILSRQREEHRPFGQIAAELGMLTQIQVDTLVRVQHARAALSLAEALALASIVPLETAVAELNAYLTPRALPAAA